MSYRDEEFDKNTYSGGIWSGNDYIEVPEEMKNFINEIEQIYKKYNLVIIPQDGHGGLAICEYDEDGMVQLLEANKWY